MKTIRLVVFAFIGISIIGAGIFAVTQSADKKPPAPSAPIADKADKDEDIIINAEDAPLLIEGEDISSSETAESVTDNIETSGETEEKAEETAKIVLGDIAYKNIEELSAEAVTWGPGVNFNEDNQPAACVTLQEKYGNLGAIFLHGDNRIYLTFDLGYESGFTNDILDTLKENGVKATFFLTGSYAKNQQEIVKRIISEGHTVGNHSNTHPDITTLSAEEAAEEIMAVHKVVKENYGYESYLFRFPAGTFSEKTLAIAAENGYHSVFWSFAYNDWDNANQPDRAEALQKLCDRLHGGAVYLLHPMETNSLILGDFIKAAKDAGYEIGIM